MNGLISAISNAIGNNALATFLMSMLPMIELKGGILFARGTDLGFFMSFLLAYLGSSFASFLVYLLLIPIFKLLKKIKFVEKFILRVEDYINQKAQDAVAKREAQNKKGKLTKNKIEWLAVFVFVGIPIPLTGVWMGTAIAVFLGMKVKHGVSAILLGNFVAGTIISIIAQIFLPYVDYILLGLFGIVFVLTVLIILKLALPKRNKKEDIDETT